MANVINTGNPYTRPAGAVQTTTPGGGTAWRINGILYTETSPGVYTEAPPTLETQYRGSGGQVSPLSGQVEVQPVMAPKTNYGNGYASGYYEPTYQNQSAVIQPSGLTKYDTQGRLVDSTTGRPVVIDQAAGRYVYSDGGAQAPTAPKGQPGVDGNTGLDGILGSLQQLLQGGGYQVPQGVEITPEIAASFMTQAQNEIHPYYASQLKIAKDTLLGQLGYTADQIAQQEQQTTATYNKGLRTIGETSADQGFAQSGIRNRNETELANQAQLTLDSQRSASLNNALGKAQVFAQQYGGSLSDIPQRYIPGAATVTPGMEGLQRGPDSPLYSLSPDVYNGLTGEKQFEEQGYTLNRARGLEGDFRSLGANTSNRNLTFGSPAAPSASGLTTPTTPTTSPYRQLYL